MSHEHIRFDDHCTYRHTMVEPQPETQDAAYVGSLYGFPVFGEAPRDEMEAAAAADDLREVVDTTGILGRYGLAGLGLGRAAG